MENMPAVEPPPEAILSPALAASTLVPRMSAQLVLTRLTVNQRCSHVVYSSRVRTDNLCTIAYLVPHHNLVDESRTLYLHMLLKAWEEIQSLHKMKLGTQEVI